MGTDTCDEVLDCVRENVKLNADQLVAKTEPCNMDWLELLRGNSPLPIEQVDLLLASDVIWQAPMGELVAATAHALVRPGGKFLLATEVGRIGINEFEAAM